MKTKPPSKPSPYGRNTKASPLAYQNGEYSSTTSAGFFDTDAAAAYLDVSPSYLNKLRCTGGGPRYAKIGRRVNYAKPDLDAWRNRFVVVSTSERRIEV